MRYKRYKLVISAPALLSAAVFVFGVVGIVLYSLEMIDRELGTGFVISINLQTLIISLLSLGLFSFSTFALLKRFGK